MATDPRVPEGSRVYAVGDIHGRADLLRRLHEEIVDDSRRGSPGHRIVIYLGDYVDRGPWSSDVIDLLVREPLPGFTTTYLKGNHEDLLLEFLRDGTLAEMWLMNGGSETLANYGIELSPLQWDPHALVSARLRFREALGVNHLSFLRPLEISHIEGDYLFVHGGLRPGVPLERQNERDLLWIRHEFIDHPFDFEKLIVHGHTITPRPEIEPHRIGIDTGAYYSGHLTCLVLEGAERRFLQT